MSIWSRLFGRDTPAAAPESRREHFRFLRSCPTFSKLPASIIEVLAGYARPVSFSTGEKIIRQGETGESFFVVETGYAEVRLTTGDSGHSIARVGPGEVIGEMALVTRAPRSADVVALTEVSALSVSAADFDELTHRYPELAVILTDLVAKRLGGRGKDALSAKDLGGCRIERSIGRGGMAVVYAARDSDSSDIALKMMSHRLIYDSDALQRFQREADIAESLEHPNIARVHRRFEAFKTYFLVMELCQGPALDDVVSEAGPLDEAIVRGILGQLARALRYVHSLDVLHRDLKPSNVMFASDGTLKLTDFGLALPLLDSDITQPGVILGTPLYMAPEQMEGLELSHHCDIYALGCIAWELLTGRSPFAEARSALGIFRAKVQWDLPPREEIETPISDEMYHVLERSLRSDVRERTLHLDELERWAAPLPSLLLESHQRASERAAAPFDPEAETRAE